MNKNNSFKIFIAIAILVLIGVLISIKCSMNDDNDNGNMTYEQALTEYYMDYAVIKAQQENNNND